MADHRWISSTGDLSSAQSYSSGSVPITGDRLDFDGTSDFNVITGLSALAAVDLTNIWVMPEYDGDIGASGNPLQAGINTFVYQGTGTAWYSQAAQAGTPVVIVDSPNMYDAFNYVTSAATTHDMMVINGKATIHNSASANFGYLMVASKANPASTVVYVGTGNTAVTFTQSGGTVNTHSVLGGTRCTIDGGTLVGESDISANWGGVINIAGGVFVYNGTGSLGYVIVASGTLDMSQDPRAKTITFLVLHPGAKFITHRNVTVSELIDLRGDVPIRE